MAVKMVPPGVLGSLTGRFMALEQVTGEKPPYGRISPDSFGSGDQCLEEEEYPFPEPGNLFSTTIKINSSYLELTDRFYNIRGIGVLLGLIAMLAFPYSLMLLMDMSQMGLGIVDTVIFLLTVIVCVCFGYHFGYLLVKSELFDLTHNPVRFDRRNRMVYAFLYNKDAEVVASPLDNVRFSIETDSGNRGPSCSVLCGHILTDDGLTVKNTFMLGYCPNEGRSVNAYLEFIRFYMCYGPEKLVDKIQYCLPIADRKESISWTLKTVISWTGPIWFLLFFPVIIPVWLCRLLANATNEVPVWPDWVEEKCRIDPDDPFVRDASMNPEVRGFARTKIIWPPAATTENINKMTAEKATTVTVKGISRKAKNAAAKKAKVAATKRPLRRR